MQEGACMVAVAKVPVTRIGETIAGKYRLLRKIGSGGMGDVFEAVHLVTERVVAVKVILPIFTANPRELSARVFREAALCSAIDHPGIVEVLDAGRDETTDALYIVFELLEGEDLETAIGSGICARDLVIVAIKLLESLAAVHAAGIVHRDIKPSNVFLARTPRGRWAVKLIDFGIALEVDDGESLERDRGMVVGTLEYMSPEQALGDPIDCRADVYAVGALLFRGLTGRLPFMASDCQKLIVKIATEDAPKLASLCPELPRALTDAVDRALERERDHRFEGAAEMARALRSIDTSTLGTSPLKRPAPAVRPAYRSGTSVAT
jgi:serine/threonine-protein kinase